VACSHLSDPSSDYLQIVAQQQKDALMRRRDGKIDANSALGANSDVQTIPGVSLGNSGGNLQLIFNGQISMSPVLSFAAL
jgi:hypothetical protein